MIMLSSSGIQLKLSVVGSCFFKLIYKMNLGDLFAIHNNY